MAINRSIVNSIGLETDVEVLQELIGGYTHAEASNVKANLSLGELGLDSIAAVQLANGLLLRLHLHIHPDELFKISPNALTEHAQKSSSALAQSQVMATLASENRSSDNLTTHPPPNNLMTIIPNATGNSTEQSSRTSVSYQPRTTPDTEVVVIAATPGLAPGLTPPNRSFNALKILAQSDSIYEAAARRSGFAGYWSSVSPLQNYILLAYVNEAFITLDVNLSEHPQGVEIPTIPCIPKHDRLMKRLLDILESRYIVMQRGGKVLRGSDRIDVDTSSHLCEQLRTQHPAFACEAKLMNLIGPRLAECLSGRLDPLSVLFGSAVSRQIMEDFYRGAPMLAAHTEQLVSFLVSLAQGMAAGSLTPVSDHTSQSII
ncbi:hypothetical protein O1611_g540 [Lasiodiplodia mahajangana]|uniref:Uncharacterized protein n=1 Tax=Lasiodiplodia mahajangana TaxID=1108764 RepID=A0ACC2K0H8_9PEZI|nr:hypothetical protein O1611_g540 [Lasiodiplodia mahajangana]